MGSADGTTAPKANQVRLERLANSPLRVISCIVLECIVVGENHSFDGREMNKYIMSVGVASSLLLSGCTTAEMNGFGNAMMTVANSYAGQSYVAPKRYSSYSNRSRPSSTSRSSSTSRPTSSGVQTRSSGNPYYRPPVPYSDTYWNGAPSTAGSSGSRTGSAAGSSGHNGSVCWNYKQVGNIGTAECRGIQ